jgi:peptidyl-tRNA hydrolase, PTH1 family
MTRHNAGFMVLDLLAGGLDWESKHDALLIKTNDVILAKPQLYMNLSGQSVNQILKYYPDATLVVVHDELDFPLGTVKIQKDVTAAGHNGVQSLIDELGTKEFIRIRLGINNPETKQGLLGDAYVLQKFTQQEEDIMKETLIKARDAVETIIRDGLEAAQAKFNG